MPRSLLARMARLEAPNGDLTRMAARSYRMLKACYEVLSRLDGDPMPTEAELQAMAQADARLGSLPNYTAVLQAVCEEHHDH